MPRSDVNPSRGPSEGGAKQLIAVEGDFGVGIVDPVRNSLPLQVRALAPLGFRDEAVPGPVGDSLLTGQAGQSPHGLISNGVDFLGGWGYSIRR